MRTRTKVARSAPASFITNRHVAQTLGHREKGAISPQGSTATVYCLFSQQMYTSIFKNGPTVITTMFCWHNINFSGGAGHIKGMHKESSV